MLTPEEIQEVECLADLFFEPEELQEIREAAWYRVSKERAQERMIEIYEAGFRRQPLRDLDSND